MNELQRVLVVGQSQFCIPEWMRMCKRKWVEEKQRLQEQQAAEFWRRQRKRQEEEQRQYWRNGGNYQKRQSTGHTEHKFINYDHLASNLGCSIELRKSSSLRCNPPVSMHSPLSMHLGQRNCTKFSLSTPFDAHTRG